MSVLMLVCIHNDGGGQGQIYKTITKFVVSVLSVEKKNHPSQF